MADLSEEDEEAIQILLGHQNSKLSAWENGFLEGISEQEWMSDKQREIFDRIWERVMGEGGRI